MDGRLDDRSDELVELCFSPSTASMADQTHFTANLTFVNESVPSCLLYGVKNKNEFGTVKEAR